MVPSLPATGTHLWAVVEEQKEAEVETTVDPAVYFKLFLRYCYRGPQVGHPHEFGAGNVCRQCGLVLGKPLDLIDIGKEGSAILGAQQGDLRVEPSQPAFEALSDAVRRVRILTPAGDEATSASASASWKTGLSAFAARLRDSGVERMVALGAALDAVLSSPGAATTELDRAALWEPVVAIYDAVRAEVAETIGPLVPRAGGRGAGGRAAEAATALATLETMTEDPFVEGPRAIQEYWCAKSYAAGADYAVTTVRASRWFKISAKHNEAINQILARNASWYGGTISANLRSGLALFGRALGAVVRAWIETVRPGWEVTDAQLLLRTLVLSAWADLVSARSWVWTGLPTPAERETAAADAANWSRALMIHVRQQFVRYSKERIRQILQQRAELERTSVVEEFASIKDDDERAAEQLKKQMRIGRWAVGKDIQKLDPDRYEFETEQRRRMGIVDPPVDPILVEGAAASAAAGPTDYGLTLDSGAAEDGYDANQLAAGDDY
jgi:hypothetical protein